MLVSAPSLHGQDLKSSPYHGDPTSIDVGKASFRLRCSACHGIHAGGGRGPALNLGVFSAGDTDLALYRVIANGVPGTEMPPFGHRNTEDNIWRIVAYLRSFEPAAGGQPEGDAGRGETVFWNQGGCGGCHRIGKRGGLFGPALTRIGRARSAEYMRDALLDPQKDLPPGYYVVNIVTADGRTLRGIGLGYDDFSAQLIDSAGEIHSYLREDAKSIEREFTSLMPDTYGQMLTEDQQTDLLAYMQGLRGEENHQ